MAKVVDNVNEKKKEQNFNLQGLFPLKILEVGYIPCTCFKTVGSFHVDPEHEIGHSWPYEWMETCTH